MERGGEWGCCTMFCLAQVCLESQAGPGTVLALNLSCGSGQCGGGRDQQPGAHNQLFQGWAELSGGRMLVMLLALPRAGRSSPKCLPRSIMAKIGLWKMTGLGSALRRAVAGAVTGCLAGGVHACVHTLHSDNPEVSQALVRWGQCWRQWAQDTVLRKQPASASTALFPHSGLLAAGLATLVVQTSNSL